MFRFLPVSGKNLEELRYITGITPYPRHATADVQQWLNLRF